MPLVPPPAAVKRKLPAPMNEIEPSEFGVSAVKDTIKIVSPSGSLSLVRTLKSVVAPAVQLTLTESLTAFGGRLAPVVPPLTVITCVLVLLAVFVSLAAEVVAVTVKLPAAEGVPETGQVID